MNASQILSLARRGRPDRAALNLGLSRTGAWSRPVRLLRIIRRYPHQGGQVFDLAYLGSCWRQGRAMR
jgi:hypothetical protein